MDLTWPRKYRWETGVRRALPGITVSSFHINYVAVEVALCQAARRFCLDASQHGDRHREYRWCIATQQTVINRGHKWNTWVIFLAKMRCTDAFTIVSYFQWWRWLGWLAGGANANDDVSHHLNGIPVAKAWWRLPNISALFLQASTGPPITLNVEWANYCHLQTCGRKGLEYIRLSRDTFVGTRNDLNTRIPIGSRWNPYCRVLRVTRPPRLPDSSTQASHHLGVLGVKLAAIAWLLRL